MPNVLGMPIFQSPWHISAADEQNVMKSLLEIINQITFWSKWDNVDYKCTL